MMIFESFECEVFILQKVIRNWEFVKLIRLLMKSSSIWLIVIYELKFIIMIPQINHNLNIKTKS